VLVVSTGDRARAARWGAAADVLAQVRRRPGITRVELARTLRLSSGSAAEITARLRELRLLAEAPAPAHGRGRPTGVLSAHPDGPLVLVVELRHDDRRTGTAGLDGRLGPVTRRRHDGDPDRVLRAIAAEIDAARRERPGRVRAIGLAVAGTVRDGRLVQSASLGWGPVELAGLTSLPLLVGNDATLAGVAEARTGAATGARAALHLTIEVGIGGALIVDGQAVGGAGGAAGEYGHLPFGDGSLRCRCGARGCWDLEVDGRALARHLGDPPPADPRGYTGAVLTRADRDAPGRAAVERVVAALGRGLAGLVHVHDPDVVTLGGLAIALRAAARPAFDSAYLDGLMTHRRAHPPPVLDAVHGSDGALHGAAAVALDHITDPAGLAAWADDPRPHSPS
jgi:predicted NBD/HSP70 family sugar kinase